MFEDVVYNADDEVLVISIQRANDDREKMNIPVFNLHRLAEDTL